jgi:signal transduction histidine kinase
MRFVRRFDGNLVLSGCFSRACCFLLLLAPATELPADELPDQADYSQPWQITAYAKEAGLSQQRVFDIAFTQNGDAWLAADSGLHRFDGFAWERFGTNHGLPSSFLRAVCVDDANRLWVGSDAGAGEWDFQRQKYDAHGSQFGLANANVREIDQDPDGTFWFSCDQWPETTGKPGGLTRYQPKAGEWQTFCQTNGLPMDYVIGYFRDSSGRQFVMSPHGWAQRQGEAWQPPANPGYQAEDCVLQMAGGRDGTLFAQGEHTLLTLTDGRWQEHHDSRTRLVCTTHSGEVVAVECEPDRNRLWFSLWDGHEFVRASAMISYPAGQRLYHLREAPDGALWCVGIGTVVRWAYHAGKWTLYPHLPPPVGADALGRIWYAGGSNIVINAGGHFQTLAPGRFWALDKTGVAMISDESRNQLLATDPQDPSRRTVVETGAQTLNSVVSAKPGVFWILGQDTNKNGVVTRYDHGKTRIITSPEFADRQLTLAVPESPAQVLVVGHQWENTRYGVARVGDGTVAWLPLTPAALSVTYANVAIGGGRRWLFGYSGLYEQSPTAADQWQQINAFPHGGFVYPLGNDLEAIFTFSGGSSGHSGCALYCSNQWSWTSGEFARPTFGSDEKCIYLPGHGGVFIRRQPGTLDLEYLQIPDDVQVNIAVADSTGNLWLGTEVGTLRYRPAHDPPGILASASATELRLGTPLPVTFHGWSRFEPPRDPAGFRYSWRVDNGDWSLFKGWPGQSLKLPPLSSGEHVLGVRARDVDGNVGASVAVVKFIILPEPWQSQPWFWPVVGLLALLLCGLAALSLAHIRQIAVTNSVLNREIVVRRQTEAELERARGDLERRVLERTAQLTRSNQQLLHQIAERKQAEMHKHRLEEELHQAQKMEAIGTLAGGIAHDFNNILAVIIPYCDLVRDELTARPDLQEQLGEVLKASNRAKNLVQQILTFSRRQPQEPRQVCELQPVVKETLALLRCALPSTIQLNQNIKPTHAVLADPTQIHQVLMNLCVNAQHAMEGRQGQLDVTLDELLVDDALCESHADLHPGLYVRISVRDTGCGISQEHLSRIFDPFFTTKVTGRGTGLGLAVVQGIVRSHGGAILVQTEADKGSEFQILLPAQTGPVKAGGPAAPLPPAAHGEHILIVDDEPGIIKALKRVLAKGGYRVTGHTDPQAALADFMTQSQDIDLVLTDLTMPGMNGLELAGKIHELRADLPVIIATGFAGSLITEEQLAAHPNVRRTVGKPFSPESILRVLAELLKPAGPA